MYLITKAEANWPSRPRNLSLPAGSGTQTFYVKVGRIRRTAVPELGTVCFDISCCLLGFIAEFFH